MLVPKIHQAKLLSKFHELPAHLRVLHTISPAMFHIRDLKKTRSGKNMMQTCGIRVIATVMPAKKSLYSDWNRRKLKLKVQPGPIISTSPRIYLIMLQDVQIIAFLTCRS